MDRSDQKKQYWFVIRELTSREIKRKYSRSKLGIIWSVLNPLLTMAVLSLIFSKMWERSIENYPIYYLSGYVLWHLFTESTNAAMTTLVDNKTLLTKVKYPMKIFVNSRIYTAIVNLGYSMIAYVAMLCVFRIRPHWSLLFFPVIVVCLVLFSSGIAYIMTTAYVFFGDVKHLYGVLLTLWMYMSAIFYPVDRLDGFIHTVVVNNPIFKYINAMRSIVMYGELPDNTEILIMILWAGAVYVIGSIVFNRNKNRIMQKI